MSILTSRRTYAVLTAFQAGDAVASAIPIRYVERNMDALGIPPGMRRVIPVVKAVAALGMLSVFRFPGLARLTTAMLTGYFTVAVGLHVRRRDRVATTVPAVLLLVVFAAMAAAGPDTG